MASATESGSWGFLRRDGRMLKHVRNGSLACQVIAIATVLAMMSTETEHGYIPLVVACTAQLAVLATQLLLRLLTSKIYDRERQLLEATRESREQIEELFAMTDMLQAAETYADASAVLMATAQRLLPGYGASLYIFNNSRDRLDLAKAWNIPEGFPVLETLSPANCWALKRGKPHINAPTSATLCCAHHGTDMAAVEIPMMASGQLHGLLVIVGDNGEGVFDRIMGIRRLGRALADSMSLALSNIGLREKLRTQSLRDPLTGLYNRRYMEDALERFVSLGTRSGASTAVMMLDLDNFKALNDEHGHAKGDAVLRDVAVALVANLRPTDVSCRYGGEELMAILPDCGIEDVMLRAEIVRERIEALSEIHQCRISASFGVAAVPETSTTSNDILPLADAALYAAKKAGKNCVRAAERRAGREAGSPRLAVTTKR